MEIILALAFFAAFTVLRSREQQRRIALLSSHLGRFEIEKLMETLIDGYMRALGEENQERQRQVWAHFAPQEERLRDQFHQFSQAFSQVWTDSARVSTLPIAFPFADKLFPKYAFDLRKAFEIHALGIEEVVRNPGQLTPKDRAYLLTAELMLMQHTCHWFCRSRTVASARMLARHQTRYEQVVGAVSGKTQGPYLRLTGQLPASG